MHQFGLYNVDELPVIETKNGNHLIGSVQRKDVIDAYNRQIVKYDLAGGVHSIVTAVNKDREVELTDGYSLAEIFPPDGFIGKSIKDINIRFRFGVEVILIRRTDKNTNQGSGRAGIIPTADYVIQHNDKLLVLGDRLHLESLKNG
jgi:Trk K+ transport system NAD-binding subunit